MRSLWPIRPTLGSQSQSQYFKSLECILTAAASDTSTTVYASTSNKSPMASTSIIHWTKKLIMGTPVTETLAPVMGWINTNASSKLLHLPLRCFDSLFTALLDCGASHNFISEDLGQQDWFCNPKKSESNACPAG